MRTTYLPQCSDLPAVIMIELSREQAQLLHKCLSEREPDFGEVESSRIGDVLQERLRALIYD